MLTRDDIAPGRYLRTVSDRLGVPTETLARVETVGNVWTGEYVFTVRWLNVNTGTQVRPISDRSLNLWEEDLAHFEAVTREVVATGKAVPLKLDHPKLRLSVGGHRRSSMRKMTNLAQLTLFPAEDF